MPSFYYLKPRTGALQETFDPANENNIFSLIKDWMPPELSRERDLHKIMRGYQPNATNLAAYAAFFENEIYPALRIAFPSDFEVTHLHPEYRSATDRGRLIVRELPFSCAKKAAVRLPLDHHGSGMISVVTVILTLAVLQENHRQRLHGKPMIVAIEEPEVHLHPGAQRTYLDYFRWISKKHQTIITTHSPIFVNRAQPESVTVLRRANWHDQKHSAGRGTNIKVGNTIEITHTCTSNWRDITETLGIRLSDALMAGEVNLLVEGSTEFILIPAMADALGDKLGFAFDRVFVVNGEGGNLPYLARLLQGTGNPTVVVVDNDKGGHEIQSKLIQDGPLVTYVAMPDPRELPAPFNQLKACKVEDLLDSGALLVAFNEAFSEVPAFEFLPLSLRDFEQEQLRLLGMGKPFGWIYTVGTLIDQRIVPSRRQKGSVEKHVNKRKLAEAAAKYVRVGKMPIPEFYIAKVFPTIGRLLGI